MPSVLIERLPSVSFFCLHSPRHGLKTLGDESDDDAFAEAADITQTTVRPWSFGGFARTRVGFWVERMPEDLCPLRARAWI